MTLAANSYGSLAEIQVLAAHLLDGQSAFNSTTVPAATSVETLVDRVSGVLNTALANAGFSVPVSNATAKLACDEWVVRWSTNELRKAYPHYGIADQEDVPIGNIFDAAADFVKQNEQAFKNLGVTVSDDVSNGLTFTGLLKHSERTDPDNTSYEQPFFRRGLFDA